MPKKLFQTVYAFQYLSQAAFSLLFPAGVFVLGGWLLNRYCGLGRWILIVAIVLGVLLGFGAMISFLLKTAYAIDPTAKEDNHDAARK